jgi:hypothetical protein
VRECGPDRTSACASEALRTCTLQRQLGLQCARTVLTWGSSIDGLLWWSNPLALTRTPRPQDTYPDIYSDRHGAQDSNRLLRA